MFRIKGALLPGILAACAFSLTSVAYAECFGYFDCQNNAYRQENYHSRNPASRYEDPYYGYQRMQRQSDNVSRQEENLSRDYHRDVQQFQHSRGYMRRHRH